MMYPMRNNPKRSQKTDMTKANPTRDRLERLFELHQLIKRNIKGYPTVRDLATLFCVDRKTVMRDIAWMRDRLGAPVYNDVDTRAYKYQDGSWNFPSFDMTADECAALLLAIQMSKLYPDTPIARNIESFYSKSAAKARGPGSANPLEFQSLISFHGQSAQIIKADIWNTIFNALKHRNTLRMRYLGGSHKDKKQSILVEPVHLANIGGDWYLLGYNITDRKNELWRHYSLSRIATLKPEGEFATRREFDPKSYFANRFGKYIAHSGRKPYTVVIRFSAKAAPQVLERQWHPEQKISRRKDGTVTLTLPMPSLREAETFCMSWGADAEVLRPAELRESIRTNVLALAQAYGATPQS